MQLWTLKRPYLDLPFIKTVSCWCADINSGEITELVRLRCSAYYSAELLIMHSNNEAWEGKHVIITSYKLCSCNVKLQTYSWERWSWVAQLRYIYMSIFLIYTENIFMAERLYTGRLTKQLILCSRNWPEKNVFKLEWSLWDWQTLRTWSNKTHQILHTF